MAGDSNFGSFMEGLQGGYNFTQQARANRQLEKARDYGLKDLGRREHDIGMNQADDSIYGMFETGDERDGLYDAAADSMSDPLIERLFNAISKRKKAPPPTAPSAEGFAAPPTPGTVAEYDPADAADYQLSGYADGGNIDDPEKIRERAARNRAARPGSVQQQTETVQGADRTVKQPSKVREGLKYKGVGPAAEEGAGRLARVGNAIKNTGAGYLAASTIGGAIDAYNTPTEDFAREAGIDPSNVGQSALKDAGIRAVGTMGRVGRAIMPDALLPEDRLSRAALPVSAPAAVEPPRGPSTRGSARGRAVSSGPAPAPRALPVSSAGEPQGPPAPDQIDLSEITPEEVPDMTTQDWTAYRAAAMRSARRRGMNGLDALAEVDQKITQMQQQGFTHFAQQGMALQEAGNLQGAMAAYRAAYQYFPSGADVKLGVYKGHIVGMGIDEQTGKPVGQPMLLDSERVAALIDNFRKPEAWQHWAKDRRDFAQREREYSEVVKPSAEAAARAQTSSAEAALQNADTNARNSVSLESWRASGGALGARGDQGLRDTQNAAERRLEMLASTDPELADRLQATIANAQARFPTTPRAEIIYQVLSRAGVYDDAEATE